MPLIGVLVAGSAQPRVSAPVEALLEGLRDLGYIDGRTIKIEYRWAEGKPQRLPELAVDLVRAGVDLIVATGDASTRAARAATSNLPIVMATSGDAVAAGFVSSLARPGGNVTGMTAINPELGAHPPGATRRRTDPPPRRPHRTSSSVCRGGSQGVSRRDCNGAADRARSGEAESLICQTA